MAAGVVVRSFYAATVSLDDVFVRVGGAAPCWSAGIALVTIPNQLGVAHNAHLLESIVRQVAPALGWR